MHFPRIRDLRDDSDAIQLVLASYLRVSQATYSDYESGKINVPIEALMKLADYYQTSVDYLLERTDMKDAYPKSKRPLQ